MSNSLTPTRTLAGTLLHYQYSTLRYRWIERFYILHDQLLFIVNQTTSSSTNPSAVPLSIEDAIRHPTTVIWLADCSIIQPVNNEYGGKKYVFCLTNKVPVNHGDSNNSNDTAAPSAPPQSTTTTTTSSVSSVFSSITSTVSSYATTALPSSSSSSSGSSITTADTFELYLSAKSYNDMLDWINAIQSAIQLPNLLLPGQEQQQPSTHDNDDTTNAQTRKESIWPIYQPNTQPDTTTNKHTSIPSNIKADTTREASNNASHTVSSSAVNTMVDNNIAVNIDLDTMSEDRVVNIRLSMNDIQFQDNAHKDSIHPHTDDHAKNVDVNNNESESTDDAPVSQQQEVEGEQADDADGRKNIKASTSLLIQQLEAEMNELEQRQEQLVNKLMKLKQAKKLLNKEIRTLTQQITSIQEQQVVANRDVTTCKQMNDRFVYDQKRVLHVYSLLLAKLKGADSDLLSQQMNLTLSPQNNHIVDVLERSNKIVAEVTTELQRIYNNTQESVNHNSSDAVNQPSNSPLLQATSHHHRTPSALSHPSSSTHPHNMTNITITSPLAIELHESYYTLLRDAIQLRMTCNALQLNIHKLTQEKIMEYKQRIQIERAKQMQMRQTLQYYGGRV